MERHRDHTGRSRLAPFANSSARWLVVCAAFLFAGGSVTAVVGALEPGPPLAGYSHQVPRLSEPLQATGTPESGTVMGVFFGLFLSDFEVSSFLAGTDAGMNGCPGYGVGYWLQGSETFYRRFGAIYPVRPSYPQMERQIVYVRFYGRLSPPGRYGHLGGYEHEITVLNLIDMMPACVCGAAATPVVTPDPRPDLLISDAQWHMAGFNGRCVPKHGFPVLHVCVGNDGRGAAGPFTVRTDGEQTNWRLAGLPSDESRCLAPKAAFAGYVGVDMDHEVDESNEFNNGAFVPRSTLTPPPLCQETATATPVLPDLVVDTAWQHMKGYDGYCISRLSQLRTTVCVRNQGGGPAGRFTIRADGGIALVWTVQELGVNESHCGAPQQGAARSVTVDADNAIQESDERNNSFILAMATPPVVCTPIPAVATCPPPATPTTEPETTPTSTVTPSPSVTLAATETVATTPSPCRVLLPQAGR